MAGINGKRGLFPLFWIEAAAAVICGVAVAITLSWPEWIEAVFHIDPDEGSGALEWTVVVVLCVLALGFLAAAGFEWRRHSSRSRA